MATPDELKTMNGRQIARTGNAYSAPKLGDIPALQQAQQRIKYPEAFQPGGAQPAHGFGYQPNFQEVTGPYNKVPPRSTIDAGKNIVPRQVGGLSPVNGTAYSSLGGSRPMPGTNLVPMSSPGNGYVPNWTYGDPNYRPQETPGFADEAKARVNDYRAQQKAGTTAKAPPPTFVNDTTKGLRGFMSNAIEGLSGAGALQTQIANQVINNPVVAKGRNEALSRVKNRLGYGGAGALEMLGGNRELSNGATAGNSSDWQGIDFSKPSLNVRGLPGGGEVGKPSDFKQIDFSNPSVNAPMTREQFAADQANRQTPFNANQSIQENGFAISEGKAGSFTYLQGPNGQIIKRDNTTGAMSPVQSNITERLDGKKYDQNSGWHSGGIGFDQIMAAVNSGQMSASEGLQHYRNLNGSYHDQGQGLNPQMQALMDVALNGGPDGSMTPAQFGSAKRRQHMAQQLLGGLQQMRGQDMHSALQREQMDSQRYLGGLNALNEAKRYEVEAQDKQARLGLDRDRLKLDTQKSEQEQYQPVTVKQYDQGLPVGEQVLPFNRRSGKVINAPQAYDHKSYVNDFMALQKAFPSKSADELHAMIEEELKGGAQ